MQSKGLSRVFSNTTVKKHQFGGRSQDGGGVGRGEHFLPYKFIKRTFKRRVNSTKQPLKAAEDISHPEKQPKSSKGGRKKYKRQIKRQKREGQSSALGRESRPGKGVLKREKLPNTSKPSHCRICAELWKHRGQHNREEK